MGDDRQRTGPAAPARPERLARRAARWRGAVFPEWVDANLRIVLAARGAMSAARAIAGVVTALYLAHLGFSGFRVGLLFLTVSVVSAAASTLVGIWSDRLGRKPFLVAVPFLAAGAAAAYAYVRTPAALFAFAALGSFGRGGGAGAASVGPYQPAESALVAEAVTRGHRAAAFGRLGFMSSFGSLIGGLLAGLAHGSGHLGPAAAAAAYRPAFLSAAALAAVAGLAALGLRLPDRSPARAEPTERPGSAHRSPGPAGVPRARRAASRRAWPRRSWPALWRLWITNGTNGLAMGAFGPFLSYWLYRRYGAGPGTIGVLLAVVNLATLASALTAAAVARKMGTVRAIVVLRVVTAALLVPMVLAPTFLLAGAVYLVRMVIQRVALPLRQSFTQDLAHPDERASMAALASLPAQATMAGGQVLAGYLFDEASLAAPFELAAVFQGLNAALFWLLFARHRPAAARAAHLPGQEAAVARILEG